MGDIEEFGGPVGTSSSLFQDAIKYHGNKFIKEKIKEGGIRSIGKDYQQTQKKYEVKN